MPVPNAAGGARIMLAIDEEDQFYGAAEAEARRGRPHAALWTFDVTNWEKVSRNILRHRRRVPVETQAVDNRNGHGKCGNLSNQRQGDEFGDRCGDAVWQPIEGAGCRWRQLDRPGCLRHSHFRP